MCGSTLDCFAQRPIWAHLHILRNAGQHGSVLPEPFPALIEEFTAVLVYAVLAPPGAAGEKQVG